MHAPDQMAGLRAQASVALGRRETNALIGRSWPSNIDSIDTAIDGFCTAHAPLNPSDVKLSS
ncbi:hypothetical protein [Deinococcus aquatilis]|uniref:hypothetical protein n=1 Tax=Deinococcus aquatilis TaxID=519440 RepID=UPI003CCBFDB6